MKDVIFIETKFKKIPKILYIVVLLSLIVNFFYLLDRDRKYSLGADELAYFAYSYNIHNFNTFDYSLNKNPKPSNQKEPLYSWVISNVFKFIDKDYKNNNIECFTNNDQICYKKNFHKFIFVNFLLFLITVACTNIFMFRLTKSYLACAICSTFLLTNMMSIDMVGHLYRENLITSLVSLFGLILLNIINKDHINYKIIILGGFLYSLLCLSHESFFLYSKFFIIFIILILLFNKFIKIDLIESNLIPLKKTLLLFLISSILISPYILRNVTLGGSMSIVSHGIENLVIRSEIISFRLKDSFKVMRINSGLTKGMTSEELDEFNYFDLENYDTIRGTYTENSYIKKRLIEKKIELSENNQLNESLRVIFFDKLLNNIITSLNILIKHSSTPKIELLKNYKLDENKNMIIRSFDKINVVFDKVSYLFFFSILIFFIIKKNQYFFFFLPILLYLLFFLFLVHYEQRYLWPMIPFTCIINTYLILVVYERSRKYFKQIH